MKYERIETVNFKHSYSKLALPIFPTIRGKSWMDKKLGKYRITIDRKFAFIGNLFYKQVLVIHEIPMDFINYDVSPISCNSYLEFCGLINSFRKYHQVTPEDEMTVLFFERIPMIRPLSQFLTTQAIEAKPNEKIIDSQEQTVYHCLKDHGPLTYNGLFQLTKISKWSLTYRVHDLIDKGLVEFYKKKEKQPFKNQKLWRIVKNEN